MDNKMPDDTEMLRKIPVHAEGTMMRREQFGAMLAGGNMAILNFNHDALAIWDLIDGIRSVADIETALAKEYKAEDVHRYLMDFMRYCATSGHITLRNP